MHKCAIPVCVQVDFVREENWSFYVAIIQNLMFACCFKVTKDFTPLGFFGYDKDGYYFNPALIKRVSINIQLYDYIIKPYHRYHMSHCRLSNITLRYCFGYISSLRYGNGIHLRIQLIWTGKCTFGLNTTNAFIYFS